MQLGNKRYIKDSIKEHYLQKLKEFQQAIQEKEKEIQRNTAEKIKRIRNEYLQKMKKELETVKASTLNEEKLKAKREYEELREELIEKVIAELRKKFEEISKSKEYAKLVKKNMPKTYNFAIVGNEKLKKLLKKAKLDKSIKGVKFITEDAEIDFSLERMLEAKIENIREVIAKELWK